MNRLSNSGQGIPGVDSSGWAFDACVHYDIINQSINQWVANLSASRALLNPVDALSALTGLSKQ